MPLIPTRLPRNAVTTAKIANSNVTTGKLDLTGQTNLTFGSTGGNQVLNIASHDLVDGGLQLAGTLVTASAAELNYLDITTLGTSEDSKAVTQSSGGVITIGATSGNQVLNVASHDLVDGGLQLAGTLVTASAAELNILDGDTSATSTTLADADRLIVNGRRYQ